MEAKPDQIFVSDTSNHLRVAAAPSKNRGNDLFMNKDLPVNVNLCLDKKNNIRAGDFPDRCGYHCP